MKKIIIILTSIIVLGAVLFGGYLYNTKLSKEYESATFSFKVPRGFKCTGKILNTIIMKMSFSSVLVRK
jgi:hypothetical protein